MRTTIDGAGRLVIPKSIRAAAGLVAGTEVEVTMRDGRVEIEPASPSMRLRKRGSHTVIETEGAPEPLSVEDVRDVLERVRR